MKTVRYLMVLYTLIPLVSYSSDEPSTTEETQEVVKIGDPESNNKHYVDDSITISEKSNTLVVSVYNGNLALVKDTRKLHLKKGLNVIEIHNISPLLELNSVSLKCSSCECTVKILSYEMLKKSSSKGALLKSSIGKTISYKNHLDKESSGILKDIFCDENSKEMIGLIQSSGKVEFVPLEKCYSIYATNITSKRNILRTYIYSEEELDEDLEIYYMTTGIKWKPECSIEVDSSLKNADIYVSGTLQNETDWNIEGANIIFDYSSPSISQKMTELNESSMSYTYPEKLTLRQSSSAVVAINSAINIDLNRSYLVKIPEVKHGNSKLPVYNLVNVEDEAISQFVKNGSEALIYLTNDNNKKFLGLRNIKLMDGLNNGGLSFAIGKCNDVEATVRYVDIKNITDKISETGVAVKIKNNGNSKSSVYVSCDIPQKNDCTVMKENINRVNQQSLLWNLVIEPNSSKEFYYKIRISKK